MTHAIGPAVGLTTATSVTPVEVDLEFVPARSPRAVERAVADDLVLLDLESGSTHVLNSIGAIFWHSLDGKTSLVELTEDLAVTAEVAVGEIGEPVLEWARGLGRHGLLTNVAPVDVDRVGAGTLRDGDPFPPIRAEHVDDGTSVSLPTLRGRVSFIVTWSFDCGFCAAMVDTIVSALPHLAASGVDVVLVVEGTRDQVRPAAMELGLSDRTVLVETNEDSPFRDLGTPVGYLLDGDGCVSGTLIVGGADVAAALRRLGGPEPSGPDGSSPAAATDADRLRYLAVPSSAAVCPSGSKPAQAWVGTSAYMTGDVVVGVRSGTWAAAALVRELLAPLAHPARDPQPNYSLVLPSEDAAPRRALNLLLWGNAIVVRSRSPRRVVEALLGHLSLLSPAADSDLWRISAFPVIHAGRAALLPGALWGSLAQVQPRLAHAQLSMVDGPVLVDTKTVELVVPVPTLPHDASVLDRLAPIDPTPWELAPSAPGRYPLVAWHFLHVGSVATFGAASLAQAAAAVEGPPQATLLDDVSAMLARLRTFSSDPSLPAVIDAARRHLATDRFRRDGAH